jgi:hypothetical protein
MASAIPAWVWWLAAPVGVALLAALMIWFAGLPRRRPTTARSIRDHDRYLATLSGVDGVRPYRPGDGSA